MKATNLLCLTLAGCSSSCGGTSKPAVNWPRVVTCTEPAQRDVLSSVTTILLSPGDGDSTTISDRAIAELNHMATTHGEHVVACLVDEAVRSFEHSRTTASGVIAAAPPATTGNEVPAEQPARKSVRTAPAPQGPAEPAQTLPDGEDEALTAAARGRDFLGRVAKTHVQADDAAHGVEP